MSSAGRTRFSQRLLLEDGDIVRVSLREGVQAAEEKNGEIILDLNRFGNWVRGFEMVGGSVPFSIARAVSPFSPLTPDLPGSPAPRTVTYDPEADAAFFYLEYGATFSLLTTEEQAELNAVSHSINPMALYGLDGWGGLVWVKVPIADATGSADQLLQVLRR